METVIERLLHEETKLKEQNQSSLPSQNGIEEAMTVIHKRRGPRCHFCNKFRHIQQNCHEREKKLALERGCQGSYQSKKTKHTVNSVNTRGQSDDTDSDEVGLVFQHVLSADVANKQADTEWIIDSGATCHVCHDRSLFTELQNLKKTT